MEYPCQLLPPPYTHLVFFHRTELLKAESITLFIEITVPLRLNWLLLQIHSDADSPLKNS